MPIIIQPLDTTEPATWDGTPASVPPVSDAGTLVRYTSGSDKVNYFTQQRTQGDLAKRDLLLNLNQQAVRDYLGTRTGIAFNCPAVLIPAGKYILVGQIILPFSQTPKAYAIAAGVNLMNAFADPALPSLPAAANISMKVVDVTTSTTLLTRLASDASSIFRASTTSVRGETVHGSATPDVVEVRLYNADTVEAIVSGFFVWQPSTHA